MVDFFRKDEEKTAKTHSPGKCLEGTAGYDILGDVHGCANTLKSLLTKMGYVLKEGAYRHPSRTVIFVGDIIDRGPHIREALKIVRAMVDAKTAQCILGNHEINALAYTTRVNDDDDTHEPIFVRAHNKRNNRQIAETLEQFAAYPEEWRDYLDWFYTLPLYLEVEGFKVVHACWDDHIVNSLKDDYNGAFLTREFICAAYNRSSFEAKAIDTLTRGTDLPMPKDRQIESSDGYIRSFFRTKFWAKNPKVFKDVVFQPDPLPEDLLEHPLSDDHHANLLTYEEHQPPVFVGHYWLQGKPRPIKPNIACVDYSAVKYGRLVAYRYCGEKELLEDNFEWVYVDPE